MTNPASDFGWRSWSKTLSAKISLAFGLLLTFSWLVALYVQLYGIPGGLTEGWIEHIRQSEFQRLSTEAEGGRLAIESWIKDRRNVVELIADSQTIQSLIDARAEEARHRNKPSNRYSVAVQNTSEWLTARRHTHGLIDALVILAADTGEILSTDNLGIAKANSSVLAAAYTLLRKSDVDEFVDVVFDDQRLRSQLLVARTITSVTNSSKPAFIVALINLDDHIKESFEGRLISFVGATAELNLYDEQGRFLIQPESKNNNGKKPTALLSVDGSKLATFARQGGEGYILTTDYRDEVVLAAYRYIRVTNEIGWGLVIKKDQKEILDGIRQHTKVFILLTAVGIFGVLVASFFVSQRITKPLREMVEATRSISGGNWQTRVQVSNQKEIADLAISFNEMARKLANWHAELEEQVKLKTEQIQTEEGKLASFSQTTIDAMVIINDIGNITFWNPSAERIFGYSAAEAIGRNVHFLLAPETLRPTATEAFTNYVATGEGPIVNSMREVPALTKSGREIIVELMVSPLTQAGRKFAIGTLRDVTQRKRTENALRIVAEHLSKKAGDEYFQSLASTLSELLQAEYVLVAQIDASPQGTATTVGASTPNGLIDNFSYHLADSPCAEVLSGTGSIYPNNLQTLFPKDLTLIEMQVQSYAGVPLITNSGAAIGLIAALWRRPIQNGTDIQTLLSIFAARAGAELQRSHAEQALEKHLELLETRVTERTAELTKKNDELANALRLVEKAQMELLESEKLASLGSLVAGVAHELNTPIGNSVMASTTLIEKIRVFQAAISEGNLRRSTLNEFLHDLDEGERYIANNLARSSELIQGFKQVAVDQTSSHRRQFDLKQTIVEISAMLKPRLKKTTHQLSIQIPENIVLDSYPGPLSQVLTNLIQNALIHAFDGKENGLISISADATDTQVCLFVTDDGCGMAENVLDHVFDPFFTTRLGQGGSGLGMNITYNLVTGVLGGRIALSSSIGLGTTVRIELPLVAPGYSSTKKIPDISGVDRTHG